MAWVPGYLFDGLLILRGDDGYESHAYQYATTSYNNKNKNYYPLSPKFIFYALHDKDVQTAIKFAREGIPAFHIPPRALSIRTGGHQYSGASSTGGENMLLDMSKAYIDLDWKDADKTLVEVGVSLTLGQLNLRLKNVHRFVPHGQCAFVHLGGHCQTGGYGQFARSIGFMTDHVTKFRLINAKGEIVDVARDSKDEKIEELFYALSGGSPGNLGVVTHVTLKVHKDENYPKSYGFRKMIPYKREKLKALLDLLVDMGVQNVSADYDVVVTMLSKREQTPHPIDQPAIAVFAQWANLKGCNQEFDGKTDTWFQKIRNIVGPIDPKTETDGQYPLSQLSSHWLFPIDREFELPYLKRTTVTKAPASYLKDKKWSEWVCSRIDKIEVPHQKLFVATQFAYTGGTGDSTPATVTNDDGKTALSWRDYTFLMTMDCFYTPDDHDINKTAAQTWLDENILQATGIDPKTGLKDKRVTPTYSEFEERRLLWGSHDLDLVANAKYYFDSEAKFKRLVDIKTAHDEKGVFSANKFCVVHRPADTTKTVETNVEFDKAMFMKSCPILRTKENTELPVTRGPILKRVEENTGFDLQAGALKHEE
ncbi:hypothetical protein BGX28_002177 [Mortierella sp. GBA30]|nr:hypothetical protein BGX28_002177 [Mortierella sp. GBA30]